MQVNVSGYEAFKRACIELGPLKCVFYAHNTPASLDVPNALALTISRDYYISGALSHPATGIMPTISEFLADFPDAIETFNVYGTY